MGGWAIACLFDCSIGVLVLDGLPAMTSWTRRVHQAKVVESTLSIPVIVVPVVSDESSVRSFIPHACHAMLGNLSGASKQWLQAERVWLWAVGQV